MGEVLACRNTSREIPGGGLGADGGCQAERGKEGAGFKGLTDHWGEGLGH